MTGVQGLGLSPDISENPLKMIRMRCVAEDWPRFFWHAVVLSGKIAGLPYVFYVAILYTLLCIHSIFKTSRRDPKTIVSRCICSGFQAPDVFFLYYWLLALLVEFGERPLDCRAEPV